MYCSTSKGGGAIGRYTVQYAQLIWRPWNCKGMLGMGEVFFVATWKRVFHVVGGLCNNTALWVSSIVSVRGVLNGTPPAFMEIPATSHHWSTTHRVR